MRKLISLAVLALFCATTNASGQLREFKIVAQGSARNLDEAEHAATDTVKKKFDTLLREELKKCGAPVQSEQYLPMRGTQNIERILPKKSKTSIVQATISFTAQDHTAVVSAEIEALPKEHREKVLSCLAKN